MNEKEKETKSDVAWEVVRENQWASLVRNAINDASNIRVYFVRVKKKNENEKKKASRLKIVREKWTNYTHWNSNKFKEICCVLHKLCNNNNRRVSNSSLKPGVFLRLLVLNREIYVEKILNRKDQWKTNISCPRDSYDSNVKLESPFKANTLEFHEQRALIEWMLSRRKYWIDIEEKIRTNIELVGIRK